MSLKQILAALVRESVGSVGAILIDREGESVDFFSDQDPYQMQVAGAHWGIIHSLLVPIPGAVREMIITTTEQQVMVGRVGDEFVLVLALHRDALQLRAVRPFRTAVKLLQKEID